MPQITLKAGIAALGLLLMAPGIAQARTDAETRAIVMQFNSDAFTKPNLSAVTSLMSPDFVDHDGPVDHDAFLAMVKNMAHMPTRAGGSGGPPPPSLTLVSGNYVLLMTKQRQADPTAPGKTYEMDMFDLYRVNADGKVAEHWDSMTKSTAPPGAPSGGSAAPAGGPPP